MRNTLLLLCTAMLAALLLSGCTGDKVPLDATGGAPSGTTAAPAAPGGGGETAGTPSAEPVSKAPPLATK